MGRLLTEIGIVVLLSSVFLCVTGNIDSDNVVLGNDLESKETVRNPYKYDPSIFDVLSSDYFDEKSDEREVENDDQGTLLDAPSSKEKEGFPVEPVVEDEVQTAKPFCVGCPIEVNPEDDKIKEIATFAFNSHLSGFEDEAILQKMIRVVNAMSQIVAGQKYILDLEVAFTNCTKSQYGASPESCTVDPEKDTFICNFEIVEQVWANNREVVRSNCKDEQLIRDDSDSLVDDYVNNEDDKMEEEVDDSGSDEDDFVEQATVPVQESVRRRKRHASDSQIKLLGGERSAEESSERILELANFAVKQLDTIDADEDARFVVDVISAKKQTVSGWLYTLKLRVAHTKCPESQNEELSSLEKCKDKVVLPYRICNIKILFQPWQEVQKRVTESQCFPEKYKKGRKLGEFDTNVVEPVAKDSTKGVFTGGYKEVKPDSESLESVIDFVVDTLDKMSNSMHTQKLVRVVQARKQVVGGIKTKLVVELGYTSCLKNLDVSSLDRSTCKILDSEEHQFCDVTVWEQPWLQSKRLTSFECGSSDPTLDISRDKRSFSGLNTTTMIDSFSEEERMRFANYLETYQKSYSSDEEYVHRLGIFRSNMRKVKLLQDNEQGTAQYGATIFADLSEEEFSKFHLGLRPDLRQARSAKVAKIPILTSIPDEFDWRHYNVVTPVKNQGLCGSCWAFSVTGNIEGLYAKKYNRLMSFSEQELVDCDTLDEGCNGGLPENAYKSIKKLGGLETESAYPYDGKNEKCSFNYKKATAKLKGFVEIPKNETKMAHWLVKNGPISIGINANAMQFYMGGVSHPWKFLCSKKSLDHGVLIVGYGVHTTSIRHKVLPYWIVKNSWGPKWGEQGYYRVYRGENTCGVAEMPTSAVLA